MTECISYQGKPLGRIMLNDNDSHKFVFVAEGLEALTILFGLSPADEIVSDAQGGMPYSRFKQEVLKDISAFYPTFDAWLFKNYPARTIAEYESQ